MLRSGNYFQQGDILVAMIDDVPKWAKKVEARNGYFVVAEGETTGHKHKIKASPEIEMLEFEGKLYLKVGVKMPLEHEEHTVIVIEPGKYEIGKVLERDHFNRVTREVID